MIGRTKTLLTPVLGVAALLVSGSLAAQQPAAAAEQAPTCKATITPQALKVQQDAFQLKVALNQAIGDPSAVGIQEENSGVQVAITQPKDEMKTEAATEEASTPTPPDLPANPQKANEAQAAAPDAAAEKPAQVVWLTLDAQAAQPGDYTIQLQGSEGTCSGTVSIAAGSGSN